MLDLLAAHARSLRGPSDIDEVVGRWADQLQADDRLAGLLYRTSFQAALGGQLMVREVELAEDDDSAARAVVSRRESPFLAMPFDDAVAFFRAKRLISEEEFDALRDRYREGGFIARRLATDRLREVARTSIARLLEQDLTTDEVYEAIRAAERDEVLSIGIAPASPHYLETVVRTNVATAYGAGRWQAVNDPDVAALRPFLRYVTAGDEAVRPMHRALHGRVFRTGSDEAAYYAPPLGFRCFPSGVVVEGTFDGAYRAWYDGEIVEVLTEHGRRLPVTPNHPIATVNGFVAAGSLHEGDDLVCYERTVDLDVTASPQWTDVDEENAPAAIEQVFGAFADSVACRVRDYRPEDFDGDALFMRGEIDVVGAPGKLARDSASSGVEQASDGVLVLADATASARGSGALLFERVDAAPRSVPRASALSLDKSPVALDGAPLQQLRFGAASRLHVARNQPAADGASRDAEFVSELLLRGSGLVGTDKVVSVKRYAFSGHVFDLQSPFSWIGANGIITSNCRCSLTTISARQFEARGYVLTEGRIDGVTPDAGWESAPGPLTD